MKSPHLIDKVELKVLALIDDLEKKHRRNKQPLSARLYYQLADLYHFNHDYRAELDILRRYAEVEVGLKSDMVEVLDRADHVRELIRLQPNLTQPAKLELVSLSEPEAVEVITVSSDHKTVRRVSKEKTPFAEKKLKVLTVSVAATGYSADEEISQIALVLFEYDAATDDARLVDSYWAENPTRSKVPAKIRDQYHLDMEGQKLPRLAIEKLAQMFGQADLVVSHNQARAERELISPYIAGHIDTPWYSSEKDIPWRAMGFETNRLTELARLLGVKPPRTCIERALAIKSILLQREAGSESRPEFQSQSQAEYCFLERIYNMRPMHQLEWTPLLERRRKQVTSRFPWLSVITSCVLSGGVIVAAIYYYL